MKNEPYTMSDAGIHGPGLGSEPISVEFLRAEPGTTLLALNQAFTAGWLAGCQAAQPTIDAYRALAAHGGSMLDRMLKNAERRLETQTLDAIIDDAEALNESESTSG